MILCYKGYKEIVQYLFEKGVDVNRKSVKGNIVLYDCVEFGSLDIMKMFFMYCVKMEKDGYGMIFFFLVSVIGYINIVDFLIYYVQISKIECINVLEFLGVIFVDKKRDLFGVLKYWKKVMNMRYSDRINIISKLVLQILIMVYDYVKEVNSVEELEGFIVDFDEMRMQVLLIRECIFGFFYFDIFYYIRYRGVVYVDFGNFK